MPQELFLDPQIRFWVFLPLLFLSFLEGILSHFTLILIGSPKTIQLSQVEDSQAIVRAKLLRQNGHLLTYKAYHMRHSFFNNAVNGYFVDETKNESVTTMHNLVKDPSFVNDMLKGNITKIIPMLIGGGWINWMFSGFITTKLPFPLALRFKPMLQRGIELEALNPSWVSSASWYFLNVFGIRNIYSLFLTEDEMYYDEINYNNEILMSPMTPSGRPFKMEWEALEIIEHEWKLDQIEYEFISKYKKIY